jgi:hypothetical protein
MCVFFFFVSVHTRVRHRSVMWIHAVRRKLMNFIPSVCAKHTHAMQSTPISSTATDQHISAGIPAMFLL